MIKALPFSEIVPVMTEVLKKGASFTFIPNGISMLPLIKGGTDRVTVSPLPDKLKTGDIVLYKRASGQFVLHRIVKKKKASYVLCGDHQNVFEYNVTRENMLAVVTEIINDEEKIILSENKKYRSYVRHLLLKKHGYNILRRLFSPLIRTLRNLKSRSALR